MSIFKLTKTCKVWIDRRKWSKDKYRFLATDEIFPDNQVDEEWYWQTWHVESSRFENAVFLSWVTFSLQASLYWTLKAEGFDIYQILLPPTLDLKKKVVLNFMHNSWVVLIENIDLLAWHLIKPTFGNNMSKNT